ncbi:16S rRNA (cytosine(1402)-N(4))-methyltransferase RsmH [Nesterenkonia sp. NBAIMH1]|uniref:16S rRNA (cytosine(1402)-N(4))-methyltransferase RsmH n=1 Tax=Nesterenkonia sp. NBAIMH1 TaxID=2600320 RepID=UPI0011B3F660|nr:16S rRNA (cytosine(1402)-N(4))-methyltransferase RsmH [Nesterenkonia sp. NBAIMH1]
MVSAESRSAGDRHTPVMLQRCIELLTEHIPAEETQAVIIDATLGMGGHTEALLEAHPAVTVIGIDRDPEAHRIAGERLARFGSRFQPARAVYDDIGQIAAALDAEQRLLGVLFDLGVSSLQLDELERGFAYSYDAPLDMRMDASADSDDASAAELLAEAGEDELRHIIRAYGEEKFAGRIARRIVQTRASQPLRTTKQLAEAVDSAMPAAAKRTGGHPAKRTFQAIRIAVNRELDVLTAALPEACDALALGGRIAVMSYHSLEDRITKQALAKRTVSSAPHGLPVELDEHKPTFRSLTRGAETPTSDEIAANPRAASAKLRAAEKIRSTGRGAA